MAALPAETALIDGEIVVEDAQAHSNFSMLQAALKDGSRDRFVYYAFDLLHLDGNDLRDRPVVERKAALKRLLDSADDTGQAVRYSEHFEEDGAVILQHACSMSLEGIVSKRADAPYSSGRVDTFIKTKCSNAQELVVGGYSPSTAMGRAIGALVVGYYDKGKFIYAGRIGTGYTHTTARDLWKRLHAMEAKQPPFDVRFRRWNAATAARRGLGRAEDGDRSQSAGLDRRRASAPSCLQGYTRRQAGERGRARAAGCGRSRCRRED